MNNDYISREDAIEVINQGKLTKLIEADVVESGLKNLPAADVAPEVHGEWEDKEVIHKRRIEEWQSARCSACGKYHTTPYMYYFDYFKFCPNCGAKMDGERKE